MKEVELKDEEASDFMAWVMVDADGPRAHHRTADPIRSQILAEMARRGIEPDPEPEPEPTT